MDTIDTQLRGGAHAAAERIARAAADAWYRCHGPHQTEAMIGTVAALALDASTLERPDAAYRARIAGACRADVGGWLAQFWAAAWIVRPDLISVAEPLYRWLEGSTPKALLRAATETAEAAIGVGVLQFGSLMRHDADLLGFLVQEVHSRQARSAGGVFHSPPEIGSLMARVILDDGGAVATRLAVDLFGQDTPAPGSSFADECAGTGELIRAAAERLRERGADPASMVWFLNDRDEVAAGCAAVGAMLWDLGPRVTVGRADILTTPDWPRAAARDADAARAHRDELARHARGFASLLRLVTAPGGELAEAAH